MNHSQQELRHAAARAFMKSLEQLDQRLTLPDATVGSPNALSTDKRTDLAAPEACSLKSSNDSITVKELEEAVADIEQFTRTKGQSNPIDLKE